MKLHRGLIQCVLIYLAMPLATDAQRTWTTSWGSAQLMPSGGDVLLKGALKNATLRQVVHLSIGGSAVRVHLSNVFGERALVVRSVKIARPRTGKPGAIEPSSQMAVPFSGNDAVTVPAGAEYFSDAVEMAAGPLSDLVITVSTGDLPECIRCHADSRAASFLIANEHQEDVQLAAAQTLHQAMRDVPHPDRLDPTLDSGDHPHSGPEGYRRVGTAIVLDLVKNQDDH